MKLIIIVFQVEFSDRYIISDYINGLMSPNTTLEVGEYPERIVHKKDQ